MLTERVNVKQHPGEDRRRWFSGDDLELIVWLDDRGEMSGFQLCYDVRGAEHAFSWRRDTGRVHERVDAGESLPPKRTPVLVPDGDFPLERVRRTFVVESADLEPWISERVLRVLDEGI